LRHNSANGEVNLQGYFSVSSHFLRFQDPETAQADKILFRHASDRILQIGCAQLGGFSRQEAFLNFFSLFADLFQVVLGGFPVLQDPGVLPQDPLFQCDFLIGFLLGFQDGREVC
jgi:hypothetical protein